MSNSPGSVILFTAFEPSGDAHAAPLIAALKEKAPDLRIFAWGGPKMEAAGAEMMGQTCDDGAMGLGGFAAAMAVHKKIREIRRWAAGVPLVAHIPVDSPAANFPICKTMRKRGVRVIHLVGPQLWAWGGWRVRKLRRLTDMVMCLLPFEEEWFRSRGVPATFVGHPVMNKDIDEDRLDQEASSFPHGAPRILLLPGSRSGEVNSNLGLLVRTFVDLRNRNSRTEGVIVASNDAMAKKIRQKLTPMPSGLHLTAGDIEPAIHWADLAVTVSGTVSLDLTRQSTPMVGIYRVGLISWLGSKLLLRTPYRLLPNIVANEEVVPEFVPYLGLRGSGPIMQAAYGLVSDKRALARVEKSLQHVASKFDDHDTDDEASDVVLKVLGRLDDSREIESTMGMKSEGREAFEEDLPESVPESRPISGFSPSAQALDESNQADSND